MRSILALALVLVFADPDPKERAALEAAAGELVRLAAFCSSNDAVAEARTELQRAIEVIDLPMLRDELAKLEGRQEGPKPGFAAKLAAERKRVHAKCAEKIADAALACSTAGREDRFRALTALIQDRFTSCDKSLERLGLAWFEPYCRWMPKPDIARLQAGAEYIDGAWLDRKGVDALNAKHGTWSDPWTIADGIHELTTTLPYRDAQHLLSYVGKFREFFFTQFAGRWDLQHPEGKLPVVVTRTQAELRDQILKRSGGAVDIAKRRIPGSAYYLASGGTLNPCFVTLEPMTDSGKTYGIPLKDSIRSLTHELTHQIAFEYSKHAAMPAPGSFATWAIEGLAVFMPLYRLERGQWNLTHPRTQAMGSNIMDSPYAWCLSRAKSLPELGAFMRQTQEQFQTGENYNVAGPLADFLLNGEGGRYREPFIRLLETAHQERETEGTFDDCFRGVDRAALQRDFQRFVAQIKLD